MAPKRIAVFTGDKFSAAERFISGLKHYTHDQYIHLKYSDTIVTIYQNKVEIAFAQSDERLENFDLVYLRGMPSPAIRHVLTEYLHALGVPVVNTESYKMQCTTKLEQNVVMALAGVPVPDSVFVGSPRLYSRAIELLGGQFPVVAKSIVGSNGNDNVLLMSQSDLGQLSIAEPIFQSFIPNQFDYRVIVAGDKVLLAYKRIRQNGDDYKNNVSKGATREIIELPDHLKAMAVSTAVALSREFTGVDILTNIETGDSVVLEANFNFGTPTITDKAIESQYYQAISEYFAGLMQTD